MAQLTVSLSDTTAAWLEARAREARYESAADFVQALVHREQAEEAFDEDALGRLIDKAEAGGDSTRAVDDIIDDARRSLGQR